MASKMLSIRTAHFSTGNFGNERAPRQVFERLAPD
jgi:hypothetical protein